MRRKRSRKRRVIKAIAFMSALIALAVLIALRICSNCTQRENEKEESLQIAGKLENAEIATVSDAGTPKAEDFGQVKSTAKIVEEPAIVARYSLVEMTDAERDLMAAVIYLEAGNQSFEGQQAVAEVILNRVIHDSFPNTVEDVLWEDGQFSVMPNLALAKPTQTQYDAIFEALHGDSILDRDVVFFSRTGENDRVWGKIGDHVFCREYLWEGMQ